MSGGIHPAVVRDRRGRRVCRGCQMPVTSRDAIGPYPTEAGYMKGLHEQRGALHHDCTKRPERKPA